MLSATSALRRRQVDADVPSLQVAGRDVLQRASHDRLQDGAQQQVAGVVWEVVVAAALVGPQDGQLVGGADGDDCQSGVDSRVLAGPHRPQECRSVRGARQLTQHERVDRAR
jgi:hypothetical protein